MNASWYDLLDVAPDASEAEIRAAWKAAIADLDPTDRRFRVYNQAAEVLLDPKRRAAYDAELAPPSDERRRARDAEAARGRPRQSTPRRPRRRGAAPDRCRTGAGGRVARAGLAARPGSRLVTAVAVAACAWLWFAGPSDAAVEESTRAAQSAAERAVGPILSYDYRAPRRGPGGRAVVHDLGLPRRTTTSCSR